MVEIGQVDQCIDFYFFSLSEVTISALAENTELFRAHIIIILS